MGNNQSHPNQESCRMLKIVCSRDRIKMKTMKTAQCVGSRTASPARLWSMHSFLFPCCTRPSLFAFVHLQPCLAYISLRNSSYRRIRKDYWLLTANEYSLLHCRESRSDLAVIPMAKRARGRHTPSTIAHSVDCDGWKTSQNYQLPQALS